MEGRRLLLLYGLILSIGSQLGSTAVVAYGDGSAEMGIDYGLAADNLPSPEETMGLLHRCTFKHVRIYEPNTQVISALQAAFPGGHNVDVMVSTRNEDLPNLAGSKDSAAQWLAANIKSYKPIIRGIIVGNEVIPGDLAGYVVPAMRNLRDALDDLDFNDVFVTTTLSGKSLTNTYPPSSSTFSPDSISVMEDLIKFQNSLLPISQGPLLVNVYPYFAYADNPADISQEYALFRSSTPVVQDGDLAYSNLFDAMFDGYVWAMEKIGGRSVQLEVGETGWPSAGNGDFTTPALAMEYNSKLSAHIMSGIGTPKTSSEGSYWPKVAMVFSLYNEDQKPEGVEQNWGLFHPDKSPVYQTPLCSP